MLDVHLFDVLDLLFVLVIRRLLRYRSQMWNLSRIEVNIKTIERAEVVKQKYHQANVAQLMELKLPNPGQHGMRVNLIFSQDYLFSIKFVVEPF